MKKVFGIVAVIALLSLAVAAMAGGTKTKAPKQAKPHFTGIVTSVDNDKDTLKSFVIKQSKRAGGKEITVTVSDSTRYLKPKKQPATAADIKVGARVTAFFSDVNNTSPVLAVMILPDKHANQAPAK